MANAKIGEIKPKRGRPRDGVVPERFVPGVSYDLYVSHVGGTKHFLSYRREGYTSKSSLKQIRTRLPDDRARREGEFKRIAIDIKLTRNMMLRFKRIGIRVYEIQPDFYDEGDVEASVRREAAKQLQCHYLETCFCHTANLECETYKIIGGGRTRRGKEIPVLGLHRVRGTVRIPRFVTIGLEVIPEQTVEIDYTLSGEYCNEGLDWVAVPIITRSVAKEPITIYFIAEYYYKFDHEPTS